MSNETKQILDKLDEIKSELDYIRKHIVDIDTALTEEDVESLNEAERDFKAGKTKRLN